MLFRSEGLFVSAMASMTEATNTGSAALADGAGLDAHLAQQHDLIRQADEYADLFTHAAMAASAVVSKAKAGPKADGGLGDQA